MDIDPRTIATSEMFRLYAKIISAEASDPHSDAPRLSLKNLSWICAHGLENAEHLPLDKISRWLGFVQGCLAMRGLIDVDEERNISRPLFHGAYRECGIEPPAPVSME